jgi:hypothetical protein
MRRAVPALATALLAAAVAAAPASSGRAGGAQLRLSGLTLSGTGFKAREHVRLIARAPDLVTRRVTTGSGGGFTMRFNPAAATICTGITIIATGDHGSKATLTRLPQQCGALP